MRYKRLMLICFVVVLFSIGSVVASDMNDTITKMSNVGTKDIIDVNEGNNEFKSIDNQQNLSSEEQRDILNNEFTYYSDNEPEHDYSDGMYNDPGYAEYHRLPSSSMFTVNISSDDVYQGSPVIVKLQMTGAHREHAYDFYLKVYDKTNNITHNANLFNSFAESRTYSIPVKSVNDLGNYNILVVNSYDGKIMAKSSFKVIFKKISENKDLIKYYTGNNQFSVHINNDNGSSVGVGQTVKFTLNNRIYHIKTDYKGYANLNINEKPGTYKVQVEYNGYVVKNTIIVKSPLVTKNVVKKFNKKGTFSVKLLNGNGKAYSNQIVKIKFKGKIHKVKTNSRGIAKLNIPKKLKADKYKIQTSYKEFSVKNTLTVKKPVSKKAAPKKKKVTKKKAKKKASKYKVITTKAKKHWIIKRSGNFKVETKIWDMTAGIRAPYKYIDTTLFKNGKQVYPTKYSVKYKINGKWTRWTKYGTTSTAHHRNSVLDSASVGPIKVKVKKSVNSYI